MSSDHGNGNTTKPILYNNISNIFELFNVIVSLTFLLYYKILKNDFDFYCLYNWVCVSGEVSAV